MKPDRNIPIPPPTKSQAAPFKKMAEAMREGESYALPEHKAKTLASAMRRLGHNCCTRRQPDGLVRVWRLK